MSAPSNVDPQEVSKFDHVAWVWWGSAGTMGMLHVINPLRSQFVFDHIDILQARVLDVGCGSGIFAESLARAGGKVVGIDQSRRTLEVARQHAAKGRLSIDYRHQTVEELAAQEADSYNIVTRMEMLEHVPDPAAVVGARARLLKPGGHAFFSTINRTLKVWLFAVIGGEYILRILSRGTHSYARLIRPDELTSWAKPAELRFVSIASFIYNPLTTRFHVALGDEDVNYMACFVRKGQ